MNLPNQSSVWLITIAVSACTALASESQTPPAPPPKSRPIVIDQLEFQGALDESEAQFVLTGSLTGRGEPAKIPLIFNSQSTNSVTLATNEVTQQIQVNLQVLQGELDEIIFLIQGWGNLVQAEGPALRDWAVRRSEDGRRFLVLRARESDSPRHSMQLELHAQNSVDSLPAVVRPLVLQRESPGIHQGILEILRPPELDVRIDAFPGLTPLQTKTNNFGEWPDPEGPPEPIRFAFLSDPHAVTLSVSEAHPELRQVRFDQFQLAGTLTNDVASFVLTGTASVRHPEGGRLRILAGDAAMTGFSKIPGAELVRDREAYWLRLPEAGNYPVRLEFDARVQAGDPWKSFAFAVPESALRPVVMDGITENTRLELDRAAPPEFRQGRFRGFLASTGEFSMRWKESRPEREGRLFYDIEGVQRVVVSPGLMRQIHVLDFHVMQGEIESLHFDVLGPGEIVRVEGANLLEWRLEETADEDRRRLTVRLNQSVSDTGTLTVVTQAALGEFPASVRPLRLRPVEAIRYGGFLQVVNDGAVRLEIPVASGLSQISPEQFPTVSAMQSLSEASQSQVFAFRFSDADYSMEVRADNIVPEVSVNQMLVYRVGESEVSLDGELELEIREAPLREFQIDVPENYVVASIECASLSDYFLIPSTQGEESSRLRLVFTQPLTGRQVLRVRLERNFALPVDSTWTVPPLRPFDARSVRGHIGLAVDAGLRVQSDTSEGLIEVGTAFFPKKIPGLQLAFRLREPAWNLALAINRLDLSMQVDAVHLFSVGEGIIYSSSILNYLIAGAPVSELTVAIPPGYGNVEFSGRDVRNWKKSDDAYIVSLHTPVFGTYTLLATCDRQFSPQGAVVNFPGAQPEGVQSDQGTVIVVSENQFQLHPETLSDGLIRLDPTEIPAEHRLLFSAPILAAYQYTGRPFDLDLALALLPQGETANQVVDRAALQTQVSREGQILTEARYFIKSKGHSHLRITVPDDLVLWEARIDAEKVVPVADAGNTLIPLPRDANPNTLIELHLKLAAKSSRPEHPILHLPAIHAPILMLDWDIEPDHGHRLFYRASSPDALIPSTRVPDASGFSWWSKFLQGRMGFTHLITFAAGFGLMLLSLVPLAWAVSPGRKRGDTQNRIGLGLGVIMLLGSAVLLFTGIFSPAQQPMIGPDGIAFAAPIEDAGTPVSVQLTNLDMETTGFSFSTLWPLLLGVAVWIYGYFQQAKSVRTAALLAGWTCLFWSALLLRGGALGVLALGTLFFIVYALVPLIQRHLSLPARNHANPPTPGAAPATLGLTLFLGLSVAAFPAAATDLSPSENHALPESVHHQAVAKDDFVHLKASLHWITQNNASLDFLKYPGVLTDIVLPDNALDLELHKIQKDGETHYRLTAGSPGDYQIAFAFHVPVQNDGDVSGFLLPAQPGLITTVDLSLPGRDVDVYSADAVSVVRMRDSSTGEGVHTSARIVLMPNSDPAIHWKPRGRDVSIESTLFYTEWNHLFVPMAGLIAGFHETQIRVAQGQIHELEFNVPPSLTITDVPGSLVNTWRFDPENRRLHVDLKSPKTGSFALTVTSQVATRPLPFDQDLGLLQTQNSTTQVGRVGVATGPEVQLEDITAEDLNPINLEDFPSRLLETFHSQVGNLTLRRAFRYSNPSARIHLQASAVQPDVRVVTQERFSIGEDRRLLAVNLEANISRAGLFQLSFPLPENLDVESLSGEALSHWTLSPTPSNNIVTLHLKGKTTGRQQFFITLVGPGVEGQSQLQTPRLTLREADKQNGRLIVVPESGIRLHPSQRQGISQLDPKQAGADQPGALAFRLLHGQWQLAFDIEQVDPWIQVQSLQDVTLKEGQIKVDGILQFHIENTGVNTLHLRLPNTAESVVFQGDNITDFNPQPAVDSPWTAWEIKLNRRILGPYLLQVAFQWTTPEGPGEYQIPSIQLDAVNLHRGFIATRAGGRIQLIVDSLPPDLQPADWQSIPPSLRHAIGRGAANETYRIINPEFILPVRVVRHEAAPLLPAQVRDITLTSTISASGTMLTEVMLALDPGDKRLLQLALPPNSRFWFAFVNGKSTIPWQEENQTLIPLEKNSNPSIPTHVDFYYLTHLDPESNSWDHSLAGPQFDLPLQNITWNLYLPKNWSVRDWNEPWRLNQSTPISYAPRSLRLESYLATEKDRQRQKTEQAHDLLKKGNEFLQQGSQSQARKAFEAAWELSQHDTAFNEDARVQLQELKQQQAVMGLNYRRNAAFRGQAATPESLPNIQLGHDLNYTQTQAQQVISQNPQDENSALQKLAERIVGQQEAAIPNPEAIRATLPEYGQFLAFQRSMQVDLWSNLQLNLKLSQTTPKPNATRLLLLAAIFLTLALISSWGKRLPQRCNGHENPARIP